jgi:hypothetical protein
MNKTGQDKSRERERQKEVAILCGLEMHIHSTQKPTYV